MDQSDSKSNVEHDEDATIHTSSRSTKMSLGDEEGALNEYSQLLGPQSVSIEDQRAVCRKQISVSAAVGSPSAYLI